MQASALRSMGNAAALERSQVAFRPPAGQAKLVARRGASSTVCMAHPRRVAKVAKQIEREVGSLLISDKILQQAVCPERRRGFDGALSALASVTEVQISNDLQVAKVYLSIYSDDMGKAVAMEGLQRLEGYVRKHIGKQVRLRLTPEIRFVRDDSIERTERIFKLLDRVKAIDAGDAEPPPLAFHGELEEDEEDWGEWGEDSEGEEDEEEGDAAEGGGRRKQEEEEGVFNTVDLGMFGGGEKRASSSGRRAAGGGGSAKQRQQRQAGSGGSPAGRQQQQQQAPKAGAAAGAAGSDKEGLLDDGEGMEEMLAAFKQQAEQRRRQA